MKPIYEPKGKAKEYGDYALNIYTGCPHRCYYCFAHSVLHRDREKFHTDVRPREGIVEATKVQLEREHITGKTIHLCFTCDPLEAADDALVTAGVLADDNCKIVVSHDGSRVLLDREKPRTEIFVEHVGGEADGALRRH